MRPYIGVLRMRLIAGFQYRAAAWAGVATQFFFGFVFICIYKAFYDSSATAPPMPFDQLISYLWMQQAFLALIMLWVQDNALLSDIKSGNIAYELTRPVKLYWLWYVRLVALRTSAAAMRCLPILAVAFFLPKPYAMMPPGSLIHGLLFAISMPLGMLLTVAISMPMYVFGLLAIETAGFRLMLNVIAEFFSGQVIAIPLMPLWLQNVVVWFPFRYASDVPLRIYSGNLPLNEALSCIGLQIFWIAALMMAGQWMLRGALRRLVVQGG